MKSLPLRVGETCLSTNSALKRGLTNAISMKALIVLIHWLHHAIRHVLFSHVRHWHKTLPWVATEFIAMQVHSSSNHHGLGHYIWSILSTGLMNITSHTADNLLTDMKMTSAQVKQWSELDVELTRGLNSKLLLFTLFLLTVVVVCERCVLEPKATLERRVS